MRNSMTDPLMMYQETKSTRVIRPTVSHTNNEEKEDNILKFNISIRYKEIIVLTLVDQCLNRLLIQ